MDHTRLHMFITESVNCHKCTYFSLKQVAALFYFHFIICLVMIPSLTVLDNLKLGR